MFKTHPELWLCFIRELHPMEKNGSNNYFLLGKKKSVSKESIGIKDELGNVY